jgi:tricarballylate dehydrogenase
VNLARDYDVLVIGGGNAGIAAAINARRGGASVLVLECAPRELRGGNSRHVRNLRCMHDAPTGVLTEAYREAEYWKDLLNVTGGSTTEHLARRTIRDSYSCVEWMAGVGVRFQPSLTGTLHLSRTNAFFLGGGKALLNAYYRHAADTGVDIAYDAEVRAVDARDGAFRCAHVVVDGAQREVRGKALVAAAGGFEANFEWLTQAWGQSAQNFLVRGTPYNRGAVLRSLLDQGVRSIGDPTQCHAVAIDARAPRFDGGIVTRVDCVSLGIVVNRDAKRFHDEGEDFWPKRYAVWGRLVAQQPDQIAYAIVDARAEGRFIPSVYPPIKAGTMRELAAMTGLDAARLEDTVREFNAAVRDGSFDHTRLDDCVTEGIVPPKTHWARRLEQPPFAAYPLRPGITFTYLGVLVDEKARIRMADDTPSRNMFAAGEIMAGNVLGKGYLAGIGMTIGTVFGRIAGTEAARHVAR